MIPVLLSLERVVLVWNFPLVKSLCYSLIQKILLPLYFIMRYGHKTGVHPYYNNDKTSHRHYRACRTTQELTTLYLFFKIQ